MYWADCQPVDGFVLDKTGHPAPSASDAAAADGDSGTIVARRDRYPGRMAKTAVLNESLALELWDFSEKLVEDALKRAAERRAGSRLVSSSR